MFSKQYYIFKDQCKRYVSTVAATMRYQPCSVGHFWSGHATAVVRERNRNFILAPTVLLWCSYDPKLMQSYSHVLLQASYCSSSTLQMKKIYIVITVPLCNRIGHAIILYTLFIAISVIIIVAYVIIMSLALRIYIGIVVTVCWFICFRGCHWNGC